MMKTLSEMTNRELFGVLTGNQGVMAQLQLQKVILACRRSGKAEGADLKTMVSGYLSGKYGA